jgi:hypothetical protein
VTIELLYDRKKIAIEFYEPPPPKEPVKAAKSNASETTTFKEPGLRLPITDSELFLVLAGRASDDAPVPDQPSLRSSSECANLRDSQDKTLAAGAPARGADAPLSGERMLSDSEHGAVLLLRLNLRNMAQKKKDLAQGVVRCSVEKKVQRLIPEAAAKTQAEVKTSVLELKVSEPVRLYAYTHTHTHTHTHNVTHTHTCVCVCVCPHVRLHLLGGLNTLATRSLLAHSSFLSLARSLSLSLSLCHTHTHTHAHTQVASFCGDTMEEIQDYLNNNNLDSYTVTALDGKGKVQLKREDNADDIMPAHANEMAWVKHDDLPVTLDTVWSGV